MLVEIQDKITAALEELSEFKTTGVWQGEVDELLKNPHNLPSAHVVFSSAEFDGPEETTIGAATASADMLWSVIIINQNLRDREASAKDSLALIELVLAGLPRLDTGHGWLWPVRAQLIGVENGKSSYGLHFAVASVTT